MAIDMLRKWQKISPFRMTKIYVFCNFCKDKRQTIILTMSYIEQVLEAKGV